MTETSNSPLFKKAFKLALNNIWRNKILSLATIFVIGIILFIFNIILALNFVANDALNNLNQKIDIVYYLKDSTTAEQIVAIQNDIAKIDGVTSIIYNSKEDALETLKANNPDLDVAFEQYGIDNPLPASIEVKTATPDKIQDVNKLLAAPEYKKYLSDSSNQENSTLISQVSENFSQVSSFTRQIIFWLIMTFLIGASLITVNSLQITIHARKKEIEVMKLVGASRWFIKLPWLIESIIYAILAFAFSIIVLLLVANNITIEQSSQLISYYADQRFLTIIAIELLATIILSAGSSLIAVHKEL